MNPTPKTYAHAWYNALKDTDEKQWEAISQNLLKRLQQEGRMAWVKQIQREMQELSDQESGIADVSVTSANDINEKEIEALVKELLGVSEVRLHLKQDKDLLGGVVLETKDKRWDLSVKGQVSRLEQTLKS